MSEQPGAGGAGGAGPAAPRKENVFTHKIGPLPMWGWLVIVGGALVAWRMYASRNAATQAQQQGTTAPGSTADNTVPQFVNQTYVTTTAPSAPSTGGGPGVPTNPSPVGGNPGDQPKPTTTLPGSWHYPAPSGLKLFNLSNRGVQFSWNAVTGPSGQHPNNYMVATYNAKGQLVNEHGTVGGNTSTAEYGPGGRGLPKGTYHTLVWANGGPIGPPGASIQYTLKG